ncbi:hypothetical protein D3C80_1409630 [compost metagenome]
MGHAAVNAQGAFYFAAEGVVLQRAQHAAATGLIDRFGAFKQPLFVVAECGFQ